MVTGAARGPGDYHGTMSKSELEREAGGTVFTGNNAQVENTRYQGAVVADGAEETRLFDTQGQLIVQKKSQAITEDTESSVSLSSKSSSSSDSVSESGQEEVVYSGWRLLDNGTYIRVYDKQLSGSEASSSSGGGSGLGHGYRQSSYSSSEQVRLDNTGGSGASESSSSSSGSSRHSSSSSSSSSEILGSSEDDNSGYMNTGWVRQPDGTYIRKQSSWSSSSSSGPSGSYERESQSQFNTDASFSSSANTIMGAAKGPGDYHGTMSKSELEREAGGRVFSGQRSGETVQQVDRTQYRGSAGTSYNSGGSGYTSGTSQSSNSHNAGESFSRSGGAARSEALDENDVVVTKGGRWVWSEVTNKWEWEDAAAQSRSRGQDSNSGSEDSGWVQLSNGTWTRSQSSWTSSSSSQSGIRTGAGGRGGVASGSVVRGVGGSGEWGDQGDNSTGWVTQPDGTMVKKSSAWASWSSSSYDDVPGGGSLDHIQRQLEQRVRNNIDNHLPSNVEPGFEEEYQRNRRSKRNVALRLGVKNFCVSLTISQLSL